MCQSCKWLAALLAILVVNASPANADTKLRFQFKAGDRLNYVIEQGQDLTTTVNGMDIKMKSKMTIHMTWTTIKVDDTGNAQVKMSVSRAKMGMEGGPFGKVEIDSKDTTEPANPIGKMLGQGVKAIASMEMTSTMSPTGQLKDIKFSEATLEKFKGLGGAGGPGGEMFGPENLKSMVSQVSLPEEAVEKGKSWTQKFEMKTPLGKTVGENKYTYEGPVEKAGRKLERIVLVPTIKIEPKEGAPVKMTIKSNKSKGEILFDNVAGRTAEVNSDGTTEAEIEAGGMTITLKTVQKVTMRLDKPAGSGGKGESRSKRS
jgi:hypothetical protein